MVVDGDGNPVKRTKSRIDLDRFMAEWTQEVAMNELLEIDAQKANLLKELELSTERGEVVEDKIYRHKLLRSHFRKTGNGKRAAEHHERILRLVRG